MASLNKVQLIGNIGRDAEVRYTKGGDAIANFSVATTETWNGANGKQEKTEWHRVDIFGKLASTLAPYLLKGKKVFVEGKLVYEEWTDKDGNKRTTPKVKVSGFNSNVILLTNGGSRDESPKEQTEKYSAPVDDEDVPF